jgi:16S rRNA U516 pseudouridylate synthase RsuA-like enzyme
MCSFCGYEVRKLKRVRIMNIGLKNLKLGEWRDFTAQELEGIMKMVATSSKTTEKFNADDYED